MSAKGRRGQSEDGESGGQSGPTRRVVLGAAAAGVVGAVAGGFVLADHSGDHGTNDNAGQVADSSSARAVADQAKPVAEEDLPGDADWRITSAGQPDAIVGYADQFSVLPGQDFDLYVSTTSTSYQVHAFRVGWYGGAQARRPPF